ncbi:hypothetical protein [Bacillus salipaludis]|uniref:Uncharacterized protein n=1 Tax=Bacillus salipaludis TaxID=2547811 RepID=A0AA90R334_9BACI|nr:hypothetical protein [Bacillus salipaludis]MDQ6598475.1 hypothetical protein [Bacillus salipaludis]
MKVKSSLIAPAVAAALLVPAFGTAISNHTTSSTKTNASVQKQDQKEGQEGLYEHGKGEKRKELMNIINHYATASLKDQLTKDLVNRDILVKQLKQTPGFQKQETKEKAKRQVAYQAHKKEINAIEQQVKDGKLTKQKAHQKLDAIFDKIEGKKQEKDKGKEQGTPAIYHELDTAVQKKDKAAVNSALQKIDQTLKALNQQLQQKINANK